jgi:hypothetical protein
MAVFVAFSDESDGAIQTGPFVYGGFIAPHLVWEEIFAQRWESDVLNSDPPIASFHMTEIRNETWQAKNGLTNADAQRKIDAAVRVIASLPQLRVVYAFFDGGHFRGLFDDGRMASRGKQFGTHRLEPDYIGFMGFARGVLEYVHDNHADAERVDFVVERKTTITHYLPQYLDELVAWAKKDGRHRLLDLIGEVIPGGKDRCPLQASDLAMWHIRNYEASTAEPLDLLRCAALFHDRQMIVGHVTNDEMDGIYARARDVIRGRENGARGGVA